jgi:outer membrane immunogenic protein
MTAFNGGAPIPAATWSSSINHTYDIVRVGLNYQFGGPVVARY